jgi:hypothetical protein
MKMKKKKMKKKKKNSPESRVFRFRVSSLVGPMNLVSIL